MESNPNARLEAFCDAVFAIALTLLIIDIKIPASSEFKNNAEFWLALRHIAPSVFAFILSFVIIFITWVNHHAALKLAARSSPSFIYANGLLLITVVFLPFPTSLIGEYILTDHAAPAVILYSCLLAFQALSWILMGSAALKNHLYKNEKALVITKQNVMYACFAFVLYSFFAVIAFWYPLTVAIVISLTWIIWLILGVNIKE